MPSRRSALTLLAGAGAALALGTPAAGARPAHTRPFGRYGSPSRRLDALKKDRADWTRRSEAAAKRIEDLAKDHDRAEKALVGAREAPQAIDGKRAAMLDDFAAAEARRAKAADEPLRRGHP